LFTLEETDRSCTHVYVNAALMSAMWLSFAANSTAARLQLTPIHNDEW